MCVLKQLKNDDFENWLKIFLAKNAGMRSDSIFIDLFQEGSKYATEKTLSKRVANYLNANPKDRKTLLLMLDSLLDLLVERNVLTERERCKEYYNIFKILTG
jgi:hypothetical protein